MADTSVKQANRVRQRRTAKPSNAAVKVVAGRKSAKTAKPLLEVTPAAASSDSPKPSRQPKAKLVRDSFTMPDAEYAAIATIKKRCLKLGMAVKKSEILRAAIGGLAQLGDAELVNAISCLAVIKTGRPAKADR